MANILKGIDKIETVAGTVVDLDNIQASGGGSGGTVISSAVTHSVVGNVEYFDFAAPTVPSKISSAVDLQAIGAGVKKLVLADGTEIDVLVENKTLNGISKNWILVAGFGNGTNYDKSLTQTLITDLASLGSAGFNSAEMAAFNPVADLTGDGIASIAFYGNPSNSYASAYLEGPAWNSNWPTWFSALGMVFTVNLADAQSVTAKIQPSIGAQPITKTIGNDQHHIWNELAAENLTINSTTGNMFYLIEDGRSNAGIAHTWVA